jgi:hypothetical protein
LSYILDKLFKKKIELSGDDDLDLGDKGHNTFGLDPKIYILVLVFIGFFVGIILSRVL